MEGVEIDYCTNCKGVWLDEGELERFAGLDPKQGRKLKCPSCSGVMQTKIIENIEIDYCPWCETVWLDGGEMEKLHKMDAEEGGDKSPLSKFAEETVSGEGEPWDESDEVEKVEEVKEVEEVETVSEVEAVEEIEDVPEFEEVE